MDAADPVRNLESSANQENQPDKSDQLGEGDLKEQNNYAERLRQMRVAARARFGKKQNQENTANVQDNQLNQLNESQINGPEKKDSFGDRLRKQIGKQAMDRLGLTRKNEIEQEGVNGSTKYDRYAERLRQMRAAARARLGLEDKEKNVLAKRSAIRKYKRIKNLIRTIKISSAAGTTMGDIFVSMWTFILTAHGELIYSKFFNKKYPIANWEKWLVIMVDIFILFLFFGLSVLIYIAIKIISGDWEEIIKGVIN